MTVQSPLALSDAENSFLAAEGMHATYRADDSEPLDGYWEVNFVGEDGAEVQLSITSASAGSWLIDLHSSCAEEMSPLEAGVLAAELARAVEMANGLNALNSGTVAKGE